MTEFNIDGGKSDIFSWKYYDREGKLIDQYKYMELTFSDYKIIKRDIIGNFLVSTVWLGIDHGFGRVEGKDPILFETMIFDTTRTDTYDRSEDMLDGYQERYCTEEEALKGHEQACVLVRDKIAKD